MCERAAFVRACEEGEDSIAELCRQFGISRKTGYKWLERVRIEGEDGLQERNRAPHHHPNAVSMEMEEAILHVRQKRNWGPKKIAISLSRTWPSSEIPSVSTIGDILKRKGLVVSRKRKRHATPSSQPLAHATDANRVWCADFKGWFCTGDGNRVDPLTITDAYSRFLLGCQEMRGKTNTEHVMGVFTTLFRTYGIPERIRTDNGTPFASTGLAGLSRLSAWWIRLGIIPERIKPATPSENGQHERFHLTLKLETASPPASTPKKQQEAFDEFQKIYNEERPHEALGQATPASLYQASARPFPKRLPPVEYPDDMAVRRVRGAGQIQWHRKDYLVTRALCYQPVGLQPVDDGVWLVFYCHVCIGIFDERKPHIQPLKLTSKYNIPI
mgnify:CR=1 FL=1